MLNFRPIERKGERERESGRKVERSKIARVKRVDIVGEDSVCYSHRDIQLLRGLTKLSLFEAHRAYLSFRYTDPVYNSVRSLIVVCVYSCVCLFACICDLSQETQFQNGERKYSGGFPCLVLNAKTLRRGHSQSTMNMTYMIRECTDIVMHKYIISTTSTLLERRVPYIHVLSAFGAV